MVYFVFSYLDHRHLSVPLLLHAVEQIRLTEARVLIVGCGGLGCPAAVYLAAGGVGTFGNIYLLLIFHSFPNLVITTFCFMFLLVNITLVDDDIVEITNLHRQVMHSEDKLGCPKVQSLAQKLQRCASQTCVPSVFGF